MNYKTPDKSKPSGYSLHNIEPEFAHMLPAGCVKISDAEAFEITEKNKPDLSYAELRASAYPPITDYIDGWVKGDVVQMQAYANACLEVKAKYPK